MSLPTEWIERTRRVGQAPSKTFVAVLGTALVARATNHRLDPFALRVENNPAGYSARNLCKEVLVPGAVKARVHVGVTGREPLNNRPFISADRIGSDMKVPRKARPHLEYLCDSLAAIQSLDEEQAVAALATFLRVRIEDTPRRAASVLIARAIGIAELAEDISRFISSNPENGRRGQARVAACLDLAFKGVKTDPCLRSKPPLARRRGGLCQEHHHACRRGEATPKARPVFLDTKVRKSDVQGDPIHEG